jgi:hypothetical protein
MQAVTAIIASIAPTAALLLEWRHPINERMAMNHADKIVRDLGLANNPAYQRSLTMVIANVALGAASAANVVLTVVATFTGAIAVISEFRHLLVWLILFTFCFLTALAYILLRLRTDTYLDIAAVYITASEQLSVTRRDQFSYGVYAVNFLLLAAIILTYWITSGQYYIIPDRG